MTSAAVLTRTGSPLEIWDDLEVEAPHAGEVKVRMAASGICHSDLSVQRGIQTALPPMVLGHEGAGIIEEVGDGVTEVAVGDHVVLSWTPQCRHCFWCLRGQPEFCESGDLAPYGGLLDGTHRIRARHQVINQMSHLGTFAELTVVSADAVIKVPEDVDFKILALLGCAVLTGVGAAMNSASVAKGDSVCVIGCGGIGLNIIQGARLAGAGKIIAVDLRPYKLELASSFGATDMVDASCHDVVGQVKRLTEGRGVDVAFEAIGVGATAEQAIRMTRRGGQTIIAGIASPDLLLNISISQEIVGAGRTIKGSWYGSSDVRRDIPRMIEYYRAGELKLDELVSRVIALEEINAALDHMETADTARAVIDYRP